MGNFKRWENVGGYNQRATVSKWPVYALDLAQNFDGFKRNLPGIMRHSVFGRKNVFFYIRFKFI